MKWINSKVTLDMTTGAVLAQEGFWHVGAVAECKGGGGASGAVSYAGYLEDRHAVYLDDVYDLVQLAIVANPFAELSLEAFDPTSDIVDIDTAFDNLETQVNVLTGDLTTDYNTMADFADARYDSDYGSSTLRTAIESARNVRQEANIARSISRFAGGMADVGAVNTSAFVTGMGLIEQEHLRDASDFGTKLEFDAYKEKLGHATQAINFMAMGTSDRLAQYQALHRSAVETSRFTVVASQENIDRNLYYSTREALWGMETYRSLGNMMGSIQGGMSDFDPITTQDNMASTLAGALGGAATGATIGSI
ncbi:hypothetical protein LCGC14_2800360, partial [marine sediment metagenome]